MTVEDLPEETDELSGAVIAAAIDVHRRLGPGLLERAYQEALVYELRDRDISVATEVDLPIEYRDTELESRYRIDVLVEDELVVELKAVETVDPVHEAQLLTYLRLSDLRLGLLLNFHERRLVDGIHRRIL